MSGSKKDENSTNAARDSDDKNYSVSSIVTKPAAAAYSPSHPTEQDDMDVDSGSDEEELKWFSSKSEDSSLRFIPSSVIQVAKNAKPKFKPIPELVDDSKKKEEEEEAEAEEEEGGSVDEEVGTAVVSSQVSETKEETEELKIPTVTSGPTNVEEASASVVSSTEEVTAKDSSRKSRRRRSRERSGSRSPRRRSSPWRRNDSRERHRRSRRGSRSPSRSPRRERNRRYEPRTRSRSRDRRRRRGGDSPGRSPKENYRDRDREKGKDRDRDRERDRDRDGDRDRRRRRNSRSPNAQPNARSAILGTASGPVSVPSLMSMSSNSMVAQNEMVSSQSMRTESPRDQMKSTRMISPQPPAQNWPRGPVVGLPSVSQAVLNISNATNLSPMRPPSIITLPGRQGAGGSPYLARPFLPGGPASARLNQNVPFNQSQGQFPPWMKAGPPPPPPPPPQGSNQNIPGFPRYPGPPGFPQFRAPPPPPPPPPPTEGLTRQTVGVPTAALAGGRFGAQNIGFPGNFNAIPPPPGPPPPPLPHGGNLINIPLAGGQLPPPPPPPPPPPTTDSYRPKDAFIGDLNGPCPPPPPPPPPIEGRRRNSSPKQTTNRYGSSKAHSFVEALTAVASKSESEPKIEKFLDYIEKNRNPLDAADTIREPSAIPPAKPNLLETLMSQAGLPPQDVLRRPSTQNQSGSRSAAEDRKNISSENSPINQINKLLSTAANSLLTKLTPQPSRDTSGGSSNQNGLSDSTSTSLLIPPPPPPPITALSQLIPGLQPLSVGQPGDSKTTSDSGAEKKSKQPFVPPPMPKYDSKEELNKSSDLDVSKEDDANETKLSGLNISLESDGRQHRSDFETKKEWQDRIAAEVKVALRPFYQNKRISKEDYKTIMKKAVTKISRSGVEEINADKIQKFTTTYAEKYRKTRKWGHRVEVTSSDHEKI